MNYLKTGEVQRPSFQIQTENRQFKNLTKGQ